MTGIPSKLFLQIGDEDLPKDFNELDAEYVTWAQSKVFENDIAYTRNDSLIKWLKTKSATHNYKTINMIIEHLNKKP